MGDNPSVKLVRQFLLGLCTLIIFLVELLFVGHCSGKIVPNFSAFGIVRCSGLSATFVLCLVA